MIEVTEVSIAELRGKLRRQWLAIRGMRSRGRHWLAALAHERVGHGATGSRCYGQA